MRKQIISKLAFILIISILISAFSVNSFAENVTGTDDINAADLSYYSTYIYEGEFEPLPVTRTKTTRDNISCYRYNLPQTQGDFKSVTAYSIKNFVGGHEYNLKFKYSVGVAGHTNFVCQLAFYDGNGELLSYQVLYSKNPTSTSWYDVDINFSADTSAITSGYTVRLEFIWTSTTYGAINYYISEDIYLNDNDDEDGLLHSIIEWLRDIRDKLVNGFSNLGLTITNKLQSVQSAITNAIDGIEQWFIDLGEDIGEFFTMLKNYVLYFQHPVTLNSDGVPVDGQGNPVYVNPFTDTLDNITDTLDDVFDDMDDFIAMIQSVNVQITGYLSTFTAIFNRFNTGVPIIGVIIALAMIVIVIRKILGR